MNEWWKMRRVIMRTMNWHVWQEVKVTETESQGAGKIKEVDSVHKVTPIDSNYKTHSASASTSSSSGEFSAWSSSASESAPPSAMSSSVSTTTDNSNVHNVTIVHTRQPVIYRHHTPLFGTAFILIYLLYAGTPGWTPGWWVLQWPASAWPPSASMRALTPVQAYYISRRAETDN